VTAPFRCAVALTPGVLVEPLIKLGILIVEAMFVIGAIGSAIVLVSVGFEDFHTMFKPGEEEE
jgi:hypothetical protein